MRLQVSIALLFCAFFALAWHAGAQESDEPYFFPEDTPDNGSEDEPFAEEPFPEGEPFAEPDPEPQPEPIPPPPPVDSKHPRNVSLKVIKRDPMDGYCLTFDWISLTAGYWLASPKVKDCIGLEQHTFCPCNYTDMTGFFAASKPHDPHHAVAFDIYLSTGFSNRLEINFDFNNSPWLTASWQGDHDYDYKLNDRSRGSNFVYEIIFTRRPAT